MPTKLILTYNNKKINTAPTANAKAVPAPAAKAAVMTMNRNIRQPIISMRTIIQLPASNCSSCGN